MSCYQRPTGHSTPSCSHDFSQGVSPAQPEVMYAKERLGGEEFSPFINVDYFVYVSPYVTPPTSKAVIAGQSCII